MSNDDESTNGQENPQVLASTAIDKGTTVDLAHKALSASISKATGRKAAISVIDTIMGDVDNIQTFREVMQEAFEEDPYTFFRQIVLPLTPKQVSLNDDADGEGSGKIQINIVMVDKQAPPDVVAIQE